MQLYKWEEVDIVSDLILLFFSCYFVVTLLFFCCNFAGILLLFCYYFLNNFYCTYFVVIINLSYSCLSRTWFENYSDQFFFHLFSFFCPVFLIMSFKCLFLMISMLHLVGLHQMKNRNHNEVINTQARSSYSSSENAAASCTSYESCKRSRSIERDPPKFWY